MLLMYGRSFHSSSSSQPDDLFFAIKQFRAFYG